jgi:uncharacterized protein YbcC (UPF0753/DUF2309 family)
MNATFEEKQTLELLKKYLPSQNPLKDFIHHNPLHAFQKENFHAALETAAQIFGYRLYLPLNEYRKLFAEGNISETILDSLLFNKKGAENWAEWKKILLEAPLAETVEPRVFQLRKQWKAVYKFNLDKVVFPKLFRLLGVFLDQGIAEWSFPILDKSFLFAIRELEKKSLIKIFKSKRASALLFDSQTCIKDLLDLIVREEALYERYLFDQQFSHPGWSGMVAVLERNPGALLEPKKICLREVILFELLLEIDALDYRFGKGKWRPLGESVSAPPLEDLFAPLEERGILFEAYALWQEALEWSLFDPVLKGLEQRSKVRKPQFSPQFQALFCIDDREGSLRRHLEQLAPGCKTYGAPGFFNVDFYFQPHRGKFYTRSCPASITPKVLIKEYERHQRWSKDTHLQKNNVWQNWALSEVGGFLSGLQMAKNIFFPSETALCVSAFKHMDKNAKLTIRYEAGTPDQEGLQVGFRIEEMTDRIESLLRSIGAIDNFAPLIYIVGHGASSVNNTHYAGYDCGACNGRAGSVNARVAAYMANRPEVRLLLKERGINIPENSIFIGALHDTTKDEIEFYEDEQLSEKQMNEHQKNIVLFEKALRKNAQERARRFLWVAPDSSPERVYKQVRLRALSLFEPRPEWNHATNALCIISPRESNAHLFLDRRAFLNSYDYANDASGDNLLSILKAIAPVCGGINLEYYFSKVDNKRLGASSKLPHNVMGLIGVTNGLDGDLRTGLPEQMITIHTPLRLLVVIEQFPEIVQKTLQKHPPTLEWFKNEWIFLCVMEPESDKIFRYSEGVFVPYRPLTPQLPNFNALQQLFSTSEQNLPVSIIE